MRHDDIHDHDDIHELLALDLYGELDTVQRARLGRHLAECPECREFAAELRQGLGRLAGAAVEGDLPSGWRARLQREVEVAAPRARTPRGFALGAAAGLAAGILFAWGTLYLTPGTPPVRPAPQFASNGSGSVPPMFAASVGAPPNAQAGGELARLQRYLRK
jgi:anti-sigma factor RsiW